MINKKADMFIGETIRIVLSVMVIVLLLYLSFSLYSLFTVKTDIQQAKAHMETIENIIESLEKNGGGSEEYILLSPKGWFLAGWPSDYLEVTSYGSGAEGGVPPPIERIYTEIPKKCVDEGATQCVCFCEKKLVSSEKTWFEKIFAGTGWDILSNCNSVSVCIPIDSKYELVVNKEGSDTNEYVRVDSLIEDSSALYISLENNKLSLRNK